jgi:pyrimidine-nucleoside phosphorylase
MARLVELQGGDPSVVEDPGRIPSAPHVEMVTADTAGFVEGISPLTLGYGVMELGGGRRQIGDPVDLRVGFVLRVRVGDPVEVGTPLGEVHAADPAGSSRGREILRTAVTVGPTPPAPGPDSRVLERLPGA